MYICGLALSGLGRMATFPLGLRSPTSSAGLALSLCHQLENTETSCFRHTHDNVIRYQTNLCVRQIVIEWLGILCVGIRNEENPS